MNAVTAATPPKLDVVRVLLAAVVAPIFHKRALIQFALPVAVLDFASRVLESPESPVADLFGVATMVAVVVLTIACYRVFVLGPQSTVGHAFQWWARRATRFVGWGFVIGFISAIIGLPAVVYLAYQSAGDPAALEAAMESVRTRFIVLLLGLPAFYVLSRLTLAFPAVATLDGPGDLGKAWRQSAGNGLRLTLIVSVLPALLNLLLLPLLAIESLPLQAMLTLVMVYGVTVQAAAVSAAYRDLSELGPRNSELSELSPPR